MVRNLDRFYQAAGVPVSTIQPAYGAQALWQRPQFGYNARVAGISTPTLKPRTEPMDEGYYYAKVHNPAMQANLASRKPVMEGISL